MDRVFELIGDAEDLGERDEMAVIERLVTPAGLDLLDVGCGDGRITRQLAELGVFGLTYVEAPGQALPLDDDSMDGVFFCYSLHHVPIDVMDRALAEAMRVMKPEIGFLYVLEPMLNGSLETLYQPFHDETEVRTRAYDALKRHVEPRFDEARELRYHESVHYDTFATFADEVEGFSYIDFTREHVDTPEVRAKFELGRTDNGYVFTQHNRVNFYRGLHP
jgi:ubiquinone/menaquinone biosynthesis C-methylase UbiE